MGVKFLLKTSVITLMTVGVAHAATRDQIRIVGSSTVFPFSATVAEQFGNSTDFKTPIVESTGSGGGLKLFCSGVGVENPDIANSSRRMKAKEFELCNANGVTDIAEIEFGYDGIVIANAQDAPDFSLTRTQLWHALAEAGDKPVKWSDIDPSLPSTDIEVLGPPPSSGTRDAFEELVMEKGCEEAGKEKDFCKTEGSDIREDGVYVDAGENDNLIVSKLEANPNALGIFGFSFLDQNSDKIKGVLIDEVEPTYENIADGEYAVARSLYFYVKKAHIGVIPGLQEYVLEFASEAASGEEGYLVDKGLITLNEERRVSFEEATTNLPNVGVGELN